VGDEIPFSAWSFLSGIFALASCSCSEIWMAGDDEALRIRSLMVRALRSRCRRRLVFIPFRDWAVLSDYVARIAVITARPTAFGWSGNPSVNGALMMKQSSLSLLLRTNM
jgi:hypothetical protein